jgi:hypothetical protein
MAQQCPACDQPLLSCIRKHQQYLFCSHCRGEMPHFAPASAQQLSSGGLLASRQSLSDAALVDGSSDIRRGNLTVTVVP